MLDALPDKNDTAIPEKTEESSATPVMPVSQPARRTAIMKRNVPSPSGSSSSSDSVKRVISQESEEKGTKDN